MCFCFFAAHVTLMPHSIFITIFTFLLVHKNICVLSFQQSEPCPSESWDGIQLAIHWITDQVWDDSKQVFIKTIASDQRARGNLSHDILYSIACLKKLKKRSYPPFSFFIKNYSCFLSAVVVSAGSPLKSYTTRLTGRVLQISRAISSSFSHPINGPFKQSAGK